MRVLRKIGYQGAIVLEIPPHEQAMENLSAGFAYLKRA
jgi:sugar phosphate isomerase/epimerase